MKQSRSKLEAPFKPQIAREGIIMVLAPVLLSTGLLLWVGQSWLTESRLAYQARKSFELAAHGTQALEHMGLALSGLLKQQFPVHVARQHLDLANKETKLCQDAARESELPESILQIVDRLAQLSGNEALASKPMVSHRGPPGLAELIDFKRRYYRFAAIIEQAQAMHEAMDAVLLNKWASQNLARVQLRNSIILFFGSILAMALLLIWRFNHSIVSRLNILMGNAERVGGREQGLGAVSGTDELAYLNSVLIDADRELKKAEDDRKSIMEMVAHDMRSPLMASQVALDIVQKLCGDSLPEKSQQRLLIAMHNLSRVLQFIEDLLAIETLEAGKVELNCQKCSLMQTVDECVGSLSELAQKRGISLVNQCRPAILEFDQRRIGQVLTNYISNAIKFAPENSEITIFNNDDGGYHRIAVKDNGHGMDRASCQKVFDRYYQTEEGRKKEGYGLGLAICRLLIEAHGGEVGAESQLGKGSTFWLKIPAKPSGGAKKASTGKENSKTAVALGPKLSDGAGKGARLMALGPLHIGEKILGVALAPLAIQFVCLFVIGMGILQSEALGSEARNKNRLMASVNYAALCLLSAESSLFNYVFTDDPKYMQVARVDLEKCRNSVNSVRQHATDPLDIRNVDQISSGFLPQVTRLENLKFSPDADRIEKLAILIKSLNMPIDLNLAQKTVDRINENSSAIEIELADSGEKEKSQRIWVQSNINLFIPINIIIAFALIVLFTHRVTKRLDDLVDHARQLPKREPIVETVEGEDELSHLDAILKKTCDDLIEGEERRRTMMQMVAHDMRSPIMAAQASIELFDAMHGESLPPLGRKQLPAAERNIDRILHLLNDLLTLDKLEAGKLELDLAKVELRKMADEAISSLSPVALQRGIVLANQCDDITIAGDEVRLIQVLINLVANAIKFSADNSVITVLSENLADRVRIGVKDHGPGMDADAAARVFDKFFQAEGAKKREGFGLGLAICKLIVESHGGAVSVETQPGHGCTFWMSLPPSRTTNGAEGPIGHPS